MRPRLVANCFGRIWLLEDGVLEGIRTPDPRFRNLVIGRRSSAGYCELLVREQHLTRHYCQSEADPERSVFGVSYSVRREN
jgi:hypothetical protein